MFINSWFLYAIAAATFAAATTILAKIGLKNIDSHLATAIRTVVVLAFAWLMVYFTNSAEGIAYIELSTWIFLILSGLTAGASWLCYFRALQLGNVNKVVPIDKSSTILTMLLAFVFLREPLGLTTAIGMIFMGMGTWLMLELKPKLKKSSSPNADIKKPGRGWLLFAVLAAVFASLTAIFGRMGVAYMDASLWTALRTMVIIPLSWLMAIIAGSHKKINTVRRKNWLFLILSGMATGASWLFFYHALQLGSAMHVVPIDKLSIVLTMGFARLFLAERFSKQSLIGLALLTAGTLMPVIL